MKILKGLVGVTMIELMITSLIVVITSIIITTVYSSHLRKERRGDVINVMNSIVRVEEHHNLNSKYSLVAEISNEKANFAKKYHLIAISNVKAATYTVIAIALGDQRNDTTKGTSCALMQLKKTNNIVTKIPKACWSV